MLLALLVSILLLVQLSAQLVRILDVLSVLVLEPANVPNVSPTIMEVPLVLLVMLVHSPPLDQLPQVIAKPVATRTVRLVLVTQLENVFCVLMAMLCLAEHALNAVIPTVTSALVLVLEHATLVLPVMS